MNSHTLWTPATYLNFYYNHNFSPLKCCFPTYLSCLWIEAQLLSENTCLVYASEQKKCKKNKINLACHFSHLHQTIKWTELKMLQVPQRWWRQHNHAVSCLHAVWVGSVYLWQFLRRTAWTVCDNVRLRRNALILSDFTIYWELNGVWRDCRCNVKLRHRGHSSLHLYEKLIKYSCLLKYDTCMHFCRCMFYASVAAETRLTVFTLSLSTPWASRLRVWAPSYVLLLQLLCSMRLTEMYEHSMRQNERAHSTFFIITHNDYELNSGWGEVM